MHLITTYLITTYTLQHAGVRGLYTGIGAQVVRDIPFYASFFGSYDIICKVLKKSTDWNDTSIYFVAGGYVRYALKIQHFALSSMSYVMFDFILCVCYFMCFLCFYLFIYLGS
jgi:Mitochondrial carrier protein